MRYLFDTNIISAWARKTLSALMLKHPPFYASAPWSSQRSVRPAHD